jgi:hypothetical protein
MQPNSENQDADSENGIKYLFIEPKNPAMAETEYSPYFYAEARIDFNDVRTGLRETVSLSKALEIYSTNAEMLWVEDMIRDVDMDGIRTSRPESVRLGGLPDFVDSSFVSRMETQFVQYLLRSFVTRVYRNYTLNLYSQAGESSEEFAGRCFELLEGPRRKELDLLHDVFARRLEQTKEKHLLVDEPARLELAKAESQKRNIFFQYSEMIAELFLKGEVDSNAAQETPPPLTEMADLEERLIFLEREARQEIAKILDAYREKARVLDEYILHPNPKDIHFVRSGVLWMPPKAV